MKNLIALVGGVIFSVGLVISGMTNPQKVIGFLDLFGDWDASLAFVMGGAVIVNLILFKMIIKKKPLFSDSHNIPNNKIIDTKLILGSAMFGIGWGLVGICPGPGIVNLVTFDVTAITFVISMTVGMYIFKVTVK
jgi:uncharacterized membrane protein YedE/YeeE